MLSEVSQRRNTILYPLMWNLKRKDTNEGTYTTETDSQTSEKELIIAGGRGGGTVREFGIDTYTLLYLKWITNKDIL